MKISYLPKWHPTNGTVYRQTFRITKAENKKLFNNMYKDGLNYGDSDTGSYIASKIHGESGFEDQLQRIIVANSIVIVDKK